eukprot:5538109-Amphidinium_carterae.1
MTFLYMYNKVSHDGDFSEAARQGGGEESEQTQTCGISTVLCCCLALLLAPSSHQRASQTNIVFL